MSEDGNTRSRLYFSCSHHGRCIYFCRKQHRTLDKAIDHIASSPCKCNTINEYFSEVTTHKVDKG